MRLRFFSIFASVLIALGVAVSHAQTITIKMNQSSFDCGNATSASFIYCYGVPVQDNVDNTGNIWVYARVNKVAKTATGFISFAVGQVNLDNLNSANPPYEAQIAGLNADGSLAFFGTDHNGKPYTGKLSYTGYTIPCNRCGSKIVLTSLTITVTYITGSTQLRPLIYQKLPACDGGFYYYWNVGPSPLNWNAICSLEMDYTYTISALQAYDLWAEGDNHYGPPDMNNGIPQ